LDDIGKIIKCMRLGLFDTLTVFCQKFLGLLFFSASVLQVTTLLLNLAGVAHVPRVRRRISWLH